MLRILSWSSSLGCDKTQSPDFHPVAPEKQLATITSTQAPNGSKRKRSPSFASSPAEANGNRESGCIHEESQKFEHSRQQQPCHTTETELITMTTPEKMKQPSPNGPELEAIAPSRGDIRSTVTTEARLRTIRRTISSQLSLEILLKHNELRFIDQELAKCQVALEQLRRCTEVPYPATQLPNEMVSNGRGHALRRFDERRPAQSPAPWGVTDGPYSRHYAKWLLPDPHFDGGEAGLVTSQFAVQTPLSGRSTRGHFADFAQLAGKTPRSQRGSNHMALPAGYGEPKQKPTGPMIVKRKSDDKMVKLVCPDCGRHDFGSAQGFINHCRIGHQRNFASHDAAAEACGEVIEYEANGTVKGAQSEPSSAGVHVHPLIRSARLLPDKISIPSSFSETGATPPSQLVSPSTTSTTPSDYKGCSETPHLSALVKNKGMGLNLQDLVTDAKIQSEAPESDDEEDDMDVDTPVSMTIGRHPQVAGTKQPHKSVAVSGLGLTYGSRKRLAAHMLVEHDSERSTINDEQDEARQSISGILPSPTNESNQAPSLIDDDEEMDPQSPPSSDEIDEADVQFHVRDDEQLEDSAEMRGPDLQSPPGTCAPTPAPSSKVHKRRTSAVRKRATVKDNKHVSFASDPVTTKDNESHEKKKRKIEGK